MCMQIVDAAANQGTVRGADCEALALRVLFKWAVSLYSCAALQSIYCAAVVQGPIGGAGAVQLGVARIFPHATLLPAA